MPTPHPALVRAEAFCAAYNLRIPVLLAPMAGACPASLSIAVAAAGGMGACGGLLMQPAAIKTWASEVRAATNGGFQLNLWIPDAPATRDAVSEAAVRQFLGTWGPDVPAEAANVTLPDFAAQCQAMLDAGPAVISSIMGVYPPTFVAQMKARGIRWFATVTTVPTRSSPKAWRLVVIAAPSIPSKPSPPWSACSPCCPPSSTRSASRSSPPAASPTRAGSRPP
jgi:nitronate monooxygenase